MLEVSQSCSKETTEARQFWVFKVLTVLTTKRDCCVGQGTGYGIVLGFGIFFSVFTSLMVFLDYRFGGTRNSTEQFNCAGRGIQTGLIAVDIVSHWTWAATLLQSSNVAWKYGVSGPFWYEHTFACPFQSSVSFNRLFLIIVCSSQSCQIIPPRCSLSVISVSLILVFLVVHSWEKNVRMACMA
jgi:hypothetical protein